MPYFQVARPYFNHWVELGIGLPKLLGPKDIGSSSENLTVFSQPLSLLPKCTRTLSCTKTQVTSSAENYLMCCRQIPQGAASRSPDSLVITYTSRSQQQPSSTILAMAVPSAQRVPTAFSTLQPVQYLPLAPSRQHPTGKLEQGQQARDCDPLASSCILATSPFSSMLYFYGPINKTIYNYGFAIAKMTLILLLMQLYDIINQMAEAYTSDRLDLGMSNSEELAFAVMRSPDSPLAGMSSLLKIQAVSNSCSLDFFNPETDSQKSQDELKDQNNGQNATILEPECKFLEQDDQSNEMQDLPRFVTKIEGKKNSTKNVLRNFANAMNRYALTSKVAQEQLRERKVDASEFEKWVRGLILLSFPNYRDVWGLENRDSDLERAFKITYRKLCWSFLEHESISYIYRESRLTSQSRRSHLLSIGKMLRGLVNPGKFENFS